MYTLEELMGDYAKVLMKDGEAVLCPFRDARCTSQCRAFLDGGRFVRCLVMQNDSTVSIEVPKHE